MLFGVIRSSVAAVQRRRQLAREAARQELAAPSSAKPGLPSIGAGHVTAGSGVATTPSSIRAGHSTRGTGQLVVGKDGSLRFVADGPGRAWGTTLFGLDLDNVSVSQLFGRMLAATFHPSLRRALLAEDRSFSIPREQLRTAVAFDRFGYGSVVIGYGSGSGQATRFEEFSLYDIATNATWPIPTADPNAWVRGLALPQATEEVQKQATNYRRTVHRRIVLAGGLCAMTLVGALCLIFLMVLGGAFLLSGLAQK